MKHAEQVEASNICSAQAFGVQGLNLSEGSGGSWIWDLLRVMGLAIDACKTPGKFPGEHWRSN